MKRALIVDPDPSEQRRLGRILVGLYPQLDVDVADCLKVAYGMIRRMMPGMLITDLYLPDGSGLELLAHIRTHHPTAPRVIITRHDDEPHLLAALRHGLDGYILKDHGDKGIRSLFERIGRGEPALSPEVMRQILRRLEGDAQTRMQPATSDNGVFNRTANNLTRRETDVLALLCKGYDRHQVAETLDIKPSTVAGHIKSIYLKLDVSTRAEATLAAVRMGLVNLDG
ncbi:response regulator transcription factor [Spiribacter sp. 218]|uniref:response regulator n=1 Tax=Spiribacter pallidus TaxID=1987936 RepID=UPI00349F8633